MLVQAPTPAERKQLDMILAPGATKRAPRFPLGPANGRAKDEVDDGLG